MLRRGQFIILFDDIYSTLRTLGWLVNVARVGDILLYATTIEVFKRNFKNVNDKRNSTACPYNGATVLSFTQLINFRDNNVLVIEIVFKDISDPIP